MPIERRSSTQQLTGILIGLCMAVFAVTIGYALFRAANRGDFSLRLGDDTFKAGSVDALAPQAKDEPILFSDVAGRGQRRPIFLTHDGRRNDDGWHAFSAVAPGSADCYLEWDKQSEQFSADCTDDTFDRSGEGLEQFSWEVGDDDVLVVDLRTPHAATTEPSG